MSLVNVFVPASPLVVMIGNLVRDKLTAHAAKAKDY